MVYHFKILKRLFYFFVVLISLFTISEAEYRQDWYFDQEGFTANQNNQFGIGEESVNLFNGNVTLTYTDLRIPGHCGNDLVIQRFYNSKIAKWEELNSVHIAESWVGLGWTLHMGRLYHNNSEYDNPMVEMPDGSRHMFFPLPLSALAYPYYSHRSKEYWSYYALANNYGRVYLPNGTLLEFQRDGGPAIDEEGYEFLPLVTIQKPNFCDPIYVYYDRNHQGGRNISQIQIGGDYNVPSSGILVDFTTLSPTYDRLTAISYTDVNGGTATIQYDVQNYVDTKLLYAVTPPVGPPVTYSYNTGPSPEFELDQVHNPYGGTVDYDFSTQTIPLGNGSISCSIPTRVLAVKTLSGSDVIAGMTWHYAYPTDLALHYMTVQDPDGNISKHYFYGLGEKVNLERCEIGLNYRNEFFEGSTTLLKVEEITWDFTPLCEGSGDPLHEEPAVWGCAVIGNCFYTDCLAKAPVMSQKTITIDGDSFSIYIIGYDPFGNPVEQRETKFNEVEATRKKLFHYAWQQTNDVDHSFIRYNIVTPILQEETYDVTGGAETLFQTIRNEYWLGVLQPPYTTFPCKYGKIKYRHVDPDGLNLTTSYVYDADSGERDAGYPRELTDPRGKLWSYAWENKALKTATTPVGWNKFTRTIDAATGLIEAQADPNGRTTSFSYDALGRLTQIQYPIENDVAVSYNNDAGNHFDNVATTRGTAEYREYFDDLGRVKMVRKRVGTNKYSYIHYAYDKLGRKAFESEPTFASTCSSCPGTSYLYDAIGRITQMTTPDGTWLYANDGEATTITDPRGKTKTIVRDPFGNVTRVTDEGGNVYDFSYDLLNHLIGIDGPGTNDRTFVYDTAGRLTAESHPESGRTEFEVDPNGNVLTETFQDGDYLEQTFDDNNRLLSKFFSNNSRTFQFTYDGSASSNLVGKLKKQTFSNPVGYIENKNFDALGKLLEVEYSYPVGNYTLGYAYDNNSNIERITYPSTDFSIYLTYGFDNLVKTIPGIVDGFEHNPAGGVSTIDYHNGITTTIPTTPLLRNRPDYIETKSATTMLKLDYSYNSMGNVSEITRFPLTNPDDFTYDDLNRFKRVDYDTSSEYLDYTYDLTGNATGLTSTITGHPSWSLTYNHNKITTTGFTYDVNGNLTQSLTLGGAAKTIEYGYDNKIVSASLGGNPAVAMWYDGDGRRIKKSTNGVDTYFMHDQWGNLLAEIDGSGDVVTEYISAGSYLIARRSDSPPPKGSPSRDGQDIIDRAIPPEVSAPGASIRFTLSKSGTSIVFRFEWLAAASAYHLYGVPDQTTMDAGTWSTKFCDLERNVLGTWQTDGATWCQWTLANGNLLPFEKFVVIAENVDGEGSYGTKSSGSARNHDADKTTPLNRGCAPTPGGKVFYYYHLDHLGSIHLITDESGAVVWPADFGTNGPVRYLPFGELYKPTERDYNSASYATTRKFTGKELDSEIQLSYFGARSLEHAYPPRFTSSDPAISANFNLQNPQSFNLYGYCLNNPLRFVDPDGFEANDFNYNQNKWAGIKQQAIEQFFEGLKTISLGYLDYTDAGDLKVATTGSDFSGNEYSNAEQAAALGMIALGGSIKFERQLQKKFKHAADFGVTGNYSKANAEKFNKAINEHLTSPGVKQIQGTYRGDTVIHHLNPETGLNVMTDQSGNFISGWRLGDEQLENVLTHGGLD